MQSVSLVLMLSMPVGSVSMMAPAPTIVTAFAPTFAPPPAPVGSGDPTATPQTNAPADVVTPPALLQFVEAEPSAAQRELEAPVHVMLTLEIDTEGSVGLVEVAVSGGAPFDNLAMMAARQFRFSPARHGDEAIPVRIQFRYTFDPPPAPDPVAVDNLVGTITHRWEKTPLANVSVELPDVARRTQTDTSGRFWFTDVPPGEHRIVLRHGDFVEVALTQSVAADKRVELNVAMEPTDDELLADIDDSDVVRAPRIHKQVAESTIERDDGERVAGTQGDVLRVVQTLGGVARAPVGTSELVVWGASPADTRLYVDHVPVPRLFHTGGARSILPSPFVGGLSLLPGGFSADYGRAIGGLVRVQTADLPETFADRRLHAYASVDPIDVGGGTSAQLGERTWLSLSGRKSVLSESVDLVAPGRSRELVPIPDYWDYQAKATQRLSDTDTLQILILGAHDQVSRGIPSITPDLAFHEDTSEAFHRVGLSLQRTLSDQATMRIDAWAGIDDKSLVQDFVYVQASGHERAARAGVRVSEQRWVHDNVRLDGGIDFEFARTKSTRDGALSLPAREGDIRVFGQPPGDRIGNDRWRVTTAQAGIYLAGLVDLANGRIAVEPGVRFEPTMISGDRVLPVRETEPAVGYTELSGTFDPRLRVTWRPIDMLSVHVAGGRYAQAPAAGDMSPVFGTPILALARAWQGIAGASLQPWAWLTMSLTGFWVEQEQLTARSSLATPPMASLLVSEGRGRNYGGQSELRFRPSEQIFAWVTYSMIMAQRRDHASSSWRPFDADQTHSAQALASWRHRSGLELGGRAQLASGFPRTPVVDAVYDTRTGRYDPIFGEHNGERLPWFFQLSLRVGWQREWEALAFKAWLDVQNATNFSNAEEMFYSADYTQRHYIEGLPILPLIGMEIRR